MISNRQKETLKIIIEEYVKTAEPVGSKSISDRLNVSSATVRNDMAILEKEGYIDKTHSSSGRVPLDKGYKLYVEELMKENEEVFEEKSFELIDNVFASAIVEREDAIKKACALLSEITSYTSLALGPDNSLDTISEIELVPLRGKNYLMIVITDSGHIESKNVTFEEEETNIEELKNVVSILNEVLKGTPLNEVSYRLKYITDNKLIQEFMNYRQNIIDNFINAFMQFAETNYYISGSSNMLVQPEFQDSKKFKKLLDAFEKRELIKVIKSARNQNVSIKIGSETGIDALDDTAIVTVPYVNDKGEKCEIAVIGPTRMNYKKVITLVKYLAKDITKYYKK